jgi:hypothetical protein
MAAVGDLHGDLIKTKKALQIARVAEERSGQVVWTGGDTVVVQLGDVLDRGDTEIGKFAGSAAVVTIQRLSAVLQLAGGVQLVSYASGPKLIIAVSCMSRISLPTTAAANFAQCMCMPVSLCKSSGHNVRIIISNLPNACIQQRQQKFVSKHMITAMYQVIVHLNEQCCHSGVSAVFACVAKHRRHACMAPIGSVQA